MAATILDTTELAKAYDHALAWAEDGYSETSRAYWSGMRDALGVLLGITTEKPRMTGPDSDVAALIMLPGCAPKVPTLKVPARA